MIEIKSLSKIYKTGSVEVRALDGIDLKIDKGDFVAIVGASGSGKSTLMNILGCLDRPSSGKYSIEGISVETLNDNQRASIRNLKIGFVFQSFNLLARTSALHNVELPMIYANIKKQDRIKKAEIALEAVGLGDRLEHMPNELSGGQKQRVAIARALVNSPAILLADEPTGNLDSHSTHEIMSIFEKLNKEGVTIILVTHEDDIAARAKRVITFKDGRIVKDTSGGNL